MEIIENYKLKKIRNKIDVEFNGMMDFVRNKTVEQMIDCIKYNFEYMSKTNKFNYERIEDFYNRHKLWGSIDLKNSKYELIENNARSLVENIKDLEWLYYKLEDYRSKKILNAVLFYWLMLDCKRVSELNDNLYNQYFDLDLIHCDENEVFVDIGGYIGDTVVSFVKNFGAKNYKKIYTYEIVPSNIEYIEKNIELFKIENVVIRSKGAGSHTDNMFVPKDEVSPICKLSGEGEIKLDLVKIDDDIEENVTFIKMDIEGAEEDALLGCREKILKNHPKLALSAYHNNSHIFKLAKIINEIDPSYKFYFRYYGSQSLPTEYVLYAI
ncbi:MAG: FkbM family methyltransferase [Clostridia bacterium]|nr:FkbM family methyltransferase [Clostridia bacterium]